MPPVNYTSHRLGLVDKMRQSSSLVWTPKSGFQLEANDRDFEQLLRHRNYIVFAGFGSHHSCGAVAYIVELKMG